VEQEGLAALDELVALAGRADKLERERAASWDAEGSPSYRFHLEPHRAEAAEKRAVFAREAYEIQVKRAEAAEARADEFERDQAATAEEWRREQARADELQRERDEALERVRSRHGDVAKACERAENAYRERDEARREADQLRAALQEMVDVLPQSWDYYVRVGRAALAGVQADSKDSA
jgi:seryl-tRNA synthetase